MDIATIMDALSATWSQLAVVAVLLLSLVQIAPIKINPWSWLGKIVGQAINGDLIRRVDDLAKDFASFRTAATERSVIEARSRITLFSDELLHDTKHSKDAFDQILADIDYYTDYCRRNPDFKNEITAASIDEIKTCYAQCLHQHDFL